jgi:hypothetical protein
MNKSHYIRTLKSLTNWCPLKQGNFLVSISRLNFLKTIRNVYPESYLENVENSKTRSVINVGENEFSLDITVTYDIPRGLVSITDYQNLQ